MYETIEQLQRDGLTSHEICEILGLTEKDWNDYFLHSMKN